MLLGGWLSELQGFVAWTLVLEEPQVTCLQYLAMPGCQRCLHCAGIQGFVSHGIAVASDCCRQTEVNCLDIEPVKVVYAVYRLLGCRENPFSCCLRAEVKEEASPQVGRGSWCRCVDASCLLGTSADLQNSYIRRAHVKAARLQLGHEISMLEAPATHDTRPTANIGALPTNSNRVLGPIIL